MQPRVLQRLALTAVLVLGAGVSVVSTSAARPARPGPRIQTPRSSFNLFAGVAALRVNANRVDCFGLTNYGNQCTNLVGSGTVEGGFWPNGTGDSYVFNGGLQMAGTVLYDTTAGEPLTGPWVGDTVGVFFMDPTGFYRQGDAVTNIYSSLNANDVAPGVWPSAAFIKDPSLYNAALLGRQSISQQDTWVRYWDGNTTITSGRKHAMGVLVEQRGLLWNFPAGNQDIMYFLFRFINITATDPAAYAGLSAAGYSASDIGDIVNIATNFHNSVQAAYGVTLPASGYTFHNVYANYFQDADEGTESSLNFSQAILPFSLVSVMKDNYSEPLWSYPAAAFGDPFYPAPGFEAVKYLQSPIDSNPADAGDPNKYGKPFGITVWGNTCNACGIFNDANGVPQMYRYISGHPTPSLGDGICNSDPVILHTCQSTQAPADTRFFEASGPFELRPGQSSVIVVALIFAAPLHKWAATSNGIYAMPAGQLDGPGGYLGASAAANPTFQPGFPASPDTLAQVGTGSGSRVCTTACGKQATIREPVERVMGWGQFSDANADGTLEQNEVQTAPGSLLDKAKVAQAIFDAKFLLPFAPEAPQFYLVPGDNKVTIAWIKSATETVQPGGGDPYYVVSSDNTSPLYDPDYRQYDVEGYRIWRGRTAAEMQVIAQFDYAGTSFIDYTGQVFDSNNPNCAPEIGLSANCGVAFQYPYTGTGPSESWDLAGNFVQIPPGGRVQLNNGNVLLLSADTAVTGGASGYSALTDAGVPFAFIDTNVKNGIQYFYAVTAFDVNSVKSGPSSLQSSLVTKPVTPRTVGTNALAPVLVVGVFGDDTTALNPGAAGPTVNAATGQFSGLVPPTNGASFGFLASVAEALPPGDITAKIDSVGAGTNTGIATPAPTVYVSLMTGTDTLHEALSAPDASFNAAPDVSQDVPFSVGAALVKFDPTRAANLGISSQFVSSARMPVLFSSTAVPLSASDEGQSLIEGRYGVPGGAAAEASRYLLHAVWYAEGGTEPPQPTINPFGSAANTNGMLPNVDIIYQPTAYRLPIAGGAAVSEIPVGQRYVIYNMPAAYYPADFVVTWNADSSITVRDSTHHVFLPFRTDLGPGWGFVNERVYTAANFYGDGYGAPVPTVVGYHHQYGLHPACDYTGAACTVLQNKAEYEQVDITNAGPATGSGIVLYIDGMFFEMQMAAVPASGTKWHLKAVSGTLSADCPTLPDKPADVPAACSNYQYTPAALRPAYVPGLQYKLRVTQAFGIAKTAGDMSKIHTVPDPYYVTNALETSANTKVLEFVNLPNQAIIRIYSVSGILVRVLTHNDPTGGGLAVWDLRNRNNQFVASGVYFYHVEAADGSTKIGRLTVVNFAQ